MMIVVDPDTEHDLIAAAVSARQRARELKYEATDTVAEAITKALDAGVSRAKLAAALGVSIPRVYQLKNASIRHR